VDMEVYTAMCILAGRGQPPKVTDNHKRSPTTTKGHQQPQKVTNNHNTNQDRSSKHASRGIITPFK
jgi:hypothetical protein